MDLATLDVRCHGPERNREVVEVADMGDVQSQLAQQHVELLTLDDALGKHESEAAQSKLEVDGHLGVVLFPPEAEIRSIRLVGKGPRPVQRSDQRFEFGGTHAGRVEPAYDSAHAGAGDGVDRNLQSFEFLQHTDVRRAARTAAAQDKPHAGP